MSKDLPELSDREIVQLMAAQKTLMDNRILENEYKENIENYAIAYGVEEMID